MSLIKQWKDGISFEEKTIIILFNGTRSTSSESYQDKVSELYTKYKHFFPGELISRRTEIYLCHAWLSRLQNKVLFLVNQGSFFFFFHCHSQRFIIHVSCTVRQTDSKSSQWLLFKLSSLSTAFFSKLFSFIFLGQPNQYLDKIN